MRFVPTTGDFTAFNGTRQKYLARLNADGTLDASFSPWVDNNVQSLVLQPDGKMLVGGDFSGINSWTRDGIARLLGTPVLLDIRPAGDRVVLIWPNTAFSLQAAPGMAGPFTNVPGATSPYSNAIIGVKQFFQLINP